MSENAMKIRKKTKNSLWTMLKTFMPQIRPFRNKLLSAYLFNLLSIGALVLSPWPLKIIIDNVIGKASLPAWLQSVFFQTNPEKEILFLAFAFVLLMTIAAVGGAANKLIVAKVREGLGLQMRDRMLMHIQTLPPIMRLSYQSGELVMRLVSDINLFARLLTKTLPLIFRHCATMLLTLILMFWIQPRLALLTVIILPILAFLMNYYSKPLKRASGKKRTFEGNVANLAQEIVQGLTTIQAQGEENHTRNRFQKSNIESLKAGVNMTLVAVRMERAMQIAQGIAIGIVTGGGAFLVLKDLLTVGELTVFAAYMTQLLKPVEKINELASALARGLAATEKLIDLLGQKPIVREAADALTLPVTQGIFELRDVWFAYPESGKETRFILQDVNVEFESNKLTVLTGNSGCGKSTLLHLLVRLYAPERGQILLDGLPLEKIKMASLRSQISVMLQNNYLFAGTIREALTLDSKSITEEDIWQALSFVALESQIFELSDGLDTHLGENALNLSGGQRKRLALARAFLLDRPILFLDEPLANVDSESAHIILDALDKIRKNKTCLAISHQTDLMQRADVIYKIENGQMIKLNGAPSNLLNPMQIHKPATVEV